MAIDCRMNPSDRRYPFIDFNIQNDSAFDRLFKVVEEFKKQKQGAVILDEGHWLPYFEESDRAKFWWPTDDESKAWKDFWFATPLPERYNETMPLPPWDFGSMIKAIFDGEYDIAGIQKLGQGRAKLEIDPYAYPYGGLGALRALVRSFGHRITGFDDGAGYVSGDPVPPRWAPDMSLSGKLG